MTSLNDFTLASVIPLNAHLSYVHGRRGGAQRLQTIFCFFNLISVISPVSHFLPNTLEYLLLENGLSIIFVKTCSFPFLPCYRPNLRLFCYQFFIFVCMYQYVKEFCHYMAHFLVYWRMVFNSHSAGKVGKQAANAMTSYETECLQKSAHNWNLEMGSSHNYNFQLILSFFWLCIPSELPVGGSKKKYILHHNFGLYIVI